MGDSNQISGAGMSFSNQSAAMKLLRSMGLERLAWSLRRLHCPVPASALVLDVGSGGNPYPRANVLLDAYEDTFERYHASLVKDRPMVFGQAERMPFRDKAFDFVVASHVLEHTSDPTAFLGELMRVGRAGYIETPDAFFERINPFRFHRLEVTDHAGQLFIYKKASWRPHGEWVDMYERKMKDAEFIEFLKRHPAPFYVRHYWRDTIDFKIVNPEVDASWPFPALNNSDHQGAKPGLRKKLIALLRHVFSQGRRNKRLDILGLLRCPRCLNDVLVRTGEQLHCPACAANYQTKGGIPLLYPQENCA